MPSFNVIAFAGLTFLAASSVAAPPPFRGGPPHGPPQGPPHGPPHHPEGPSKGLPIVKPTGATGSPIIPTGAFPSGIVPSGTAFPFPTSGGPAIPVPTGDITFGDSANKKRFEGPRVNNPKKPWRPWHPRPGKPSRPDDAPEPPPFVTGGAGPTGTGVFPGAGPTGGLIGSGLPFPPL